MSRTLVVSYTLADQVNILSVEHVKNDEAFLSYNNAYSQEFDVVSTIHNNNLEGTLAYVIIAHSHTYDSDKSSNSANIVAVYPSKVAALQAMKTLEKTYKNGDAVCTLPFNYFLDDAPEHCNPYCGWGESFNGFETRVVTIV